VKLRRVRSRFTNDSRKTEEFLSQQPWFRKDDHARWQFDLLLAPQRQLCLGAALRPMAVTAGTAGFVLADARITSRGRSDRNIREAKVQRHLV
jgi:hypothetical protein